MVLVFVVRAEAGGVGALILTRGAYVGTGRTARLIHEEAPPSPLVRVQSKSCGKWAKGERFYVRRYRNAREH